MNNKKNTEAIYTLDEATRVADLLEDALVKYDISVPSPEDDDRDPDDDVGLYGSTYSDLVDDVEGTLISLLDQAAKDAQAIDPNYVHAESGRIVAEFEDILEDNSIFVPSPNDSAREPDDLGLEGTVFADLVESVNGILLKLLNKAADGAEIIPCEYSGKY